MIKSNIHILIIFSMINICFLSSCSRDGALITPKHPQVSPTKYTPSLAPGQLLFSGYIVQIAHAIIGKKYPQILKITPSLSGSHPEIPVKAISTCGCLQPTILPHSTNDPQGGFSVSFTYVPRGPEGTDIQIIRLLSKNRDVVCKIKVIGDVLGVFSVHPSIAAFGTFKYIATPIIREAIIANTKLPVPKKVKSSVSQLNIKPLKISKYKAIYELYINSKMIPGPVSGVVEWESGKANPSDPVLPVTGYIDGGWQSYPESLLFPPHGGGSPETVSFQLKHLSSNQAIHTPIYAKSDNPEIRVDLKQVKRSNVWNGTATIKPIPGHGEVMRGEMIILDGKGASLLRIPYMGIVMTR